MDLADTFTQRVYGIIFEDIEYYLNKAIADIEQKKEGDGIHPRGQVLLALGLMAYTEYVGNFLPSSEIENELGNHTSKDRARFDAFLRRLDDGYSEFLDSEVAKGHSVYDIFRNGLAHRCFAKRDCTIAISNEGGGFLVQGESDAKMERPVKIGMGVASNGSYYLVLQKYYEDFKAACGVVRAELVAAPKAKIGQIYAGTFGTTAAGGYGDTG